MVNFWTLRCFNWSHKILMRLRNITQEISKYFVLFYSRDWVGGCYMHESCLREKVILPPELLWTSQLRIQFRELKQVRTTTTLKKQSKFEYLKETTDNWLRVAYSMNILWHLKRFKISKRILLAILKSIKLTSSWRRENPLSGVVYRTWTPWNYSWDWKLFILFVLHEWLYCLRDVVVEANVVFA